MELLMINTLRRINRAVALAVGFGLLICAGFVLTDIIMRQIGTSLGGTEEIAGYAMALATSWGMSFTLLELGHVRIDLLRCRVDSFKRALFDASFGIEQVFIVAQHPHRLLALLERQLKTMSAVQARVHYSMKQEFQLLRDIIRDNTPPEYSFDPVDRGPGLPGTGSS